MKQLAKFLLSALTLCVLLMVLAVALLLTGCAAPPATWRDIDGRVAPERVHLECENEGLRAVAGRVDALSVIDQIRIEENCLRIKGYRPS